MKLTAKAVAALVLPAGKVDAIHFDDELRGFGYRLRLGNDGKVRRSWVCQYRRAGGTRRMLLGSAGVLSAEAARLAARKVLGAVALGQDPQADRVDRRGKDQVSMRSMVDEYLSAKQLQLRPRTFIETKRYLTTDYFKPLHSMPLDTITRRDIAARLVIIARERGNPTAARARAAVASFFTWAMRMGVVSTNPTIGTIKPPEGRPRERVLTDSELAAIWRSCKDDDYGRIVKLLILTGCRRAEIGNATWSEFDDLEQPTTFTIAAARSKNGKPHTLPVMPMMREIICSVPRMAKRDQLFGWRTYGFTGWADGKAAPLCVGSLGRIQFEDDPMSFRELERRKGAARAPAARRPRSPDLRRVVRTQQDQQTHRATHSQCAGRSGRDAAERASYRHHARQ